METPIEQVNDNTFSDLDLSYVYGIMCNGCGVVPTDFKIIGEEVLCFYCEQVREVIPYLPNSSFTEKSYDLSQAQQDMNSTEAVPKFEDHPISPEQVLVGPNFSNYTTYVAPNLIQCGSQDVEKAAKVQLKRHRPGSDNDDNQNKKKTVKRKAVAARSSVPQAVISQNSNSTTTSSGYKLFVDLQTGGSGYLYYSKSRVQVATFAPVELKSLESRSIWSRMWVENESRRFFIIQNLNSRKLKEGELKFTIPFLKDKIESYHDDKTFAVHQKKWSVVAEFRDGNDNVVILKSKPFSFHSKMPTSS